MNDKIKKYDKLDNTKRFIKSTVDHVKNSTDILTDVRLAADYFACQRESTELCVLFLGLSHLNSQIHTNYVKMSIFAVMS